MKSILLLPVAGFVLLCCSCRTKTPIDPNTMKPSERCLPENVSTRHEGSVEGTK